MDKTPESPIKLDYEITYLDPDRKLITQNSKEPIYIKPMISDVNFSDIFNPFRSDKEVDDERMFVGRDKILDEVFSYAVNESIGGLLMLNGQKRVGKSSLLSFLEKRIDLSAQTTRTLGIKVSWLDYSAHSVINVIYELFLKFKRKVILCLTKKSYSLPLRK